MTPLPETVRRYLQKFGVKGPWTVTGADGRLFKGAIVIPSLAEGDSLFVTLNALAANPARQLEDFVVIVVINNGQDADNAVVRQNQTDLARLFDGSKRSALNLTWIDAANGALAIPTKQAGVGFARKLGLDTALSLLDWAEDPLLVCLDADTLVDDQYLEAIQRHFLLSEKGAAVLPYRHQFVENDEQNEAIQRYELFLRSYVYGLRLAGSPYAFNSVGSAMACRAQSYVRCGGMNTRKAGEDFYFLQKLAKTDGVALLEGTTVMPSPRVSARVPFGTGRSMARMLDKDDRSVLIYPVGVFRVLAQWYDLVLGNSRQDATDLLHSAKAVSPVLSDYLLQLNWLEVWPTLQSTYRDEASLLEAFHVWFDGFRALRLIHLLCEGEYKRGPPAELLPAYFAWEGAPCPDSLSGMLELLRREDKVCLAER